MSARPITLIHVLNPLGPTHRAGGVLDLALGPETAFAEFAHWTSDHRTRLVPLDRARTIPLPPRKLLPRSLLDEASALLEVFLPNRGKSSPYKTWRIMLG